MIVAAKRISTIAFPLWKRNCLVSFYQLGFEFVIFCLVVVLEHICNMASVVLTHTHTRPFYGPLSRYRYLVPGLVPGEPVPEETSIHSHPSCSSTILIIFLHLQRTIASSLLNPRTLQSLCTTSNHLLFGLPLSLEPTTSYSIHFFTQSLSTFRNTCPYHRSLFCCSSDVLTIYCSIIPSVL